MIKGRGHAPDVNHVNNDPLPNLGKTDDFISYKDDRTEAK